MKKNSIKVSVILLTHNQSNILRVQMLSLENQIDIITSDFEVIITDDSSTEEEFCEIEKIVKRSHLNCKIARQKSDRYWASMARNNAIKKALGEILIFLDGDMIPEKDFIKKHLIAQYEKKRNIVAGQRIRKSIVFDEFSIEEILDLCRKDSNFDTILKKRQENEELKRNQFLNSENSWRAVFSCNMSITTNPEVLFDENFKGWGQEDWELSYRLTKKYNYSVEFHPEIIAYEVDHLGDGVGNIFRCNTEQSITDYLRNTIYFFDLCPGQNKEEVFWGFRKLHLNENNKWIISDTKSIESIESIEQKVRVWLKKWGIR